MTGLYRGYKPCPPVLPLQRGTVDFTDEAGVGAMLQLLGDAELPPVEQTAQEPFVGITTDGTPERALFPLGDEGARGADAARAARDYLAGLDPRQRSRAALPVDADEWPLWSNAFLTFLEHGLLLQELGDGQRTAALAVIEASLSPTGYAQAREAMRLNGALGELVGAYRDTLTEYCYWFTLFGAPGPEGP
jgi:hypothetical protein